MSRAAAVCLALAAGAPESVLTQESWPEVENKSGVNLKEVVTRIAGKEGEVAEAGVVKDLDVLDWFYVVERATIYGWEGLDLR